jgi:hypothetical protein
MARQRKVMTTMKSGAPSMRRWLLPSPQTRA